MCGFYGCNRLLIRFYTFQPIAMMVGTNRQMNFILTNNRCQNFSITCFKRFGCFWVNWVGGRCAIIAARYKNPPLSTLEFYAVGQLIADDHFNAIGIQSLRRKNTMHIPQARFRKIGFARHFNRSCERRSHAPVRGINVVRAPTCNHTRAKLLAT